MYLAGTFESSKASGLPAPRLKIACWCAVLQTRWVGMHSSCRMHQQALGFQMCPTCTESGAEEEWYCDDSGLLLHEGSCNPRGLAESPETPHLIVLSVAARTNLVTWQVDSWHLAHQRKHQGATG